MTLVQIKKEKLENSMRVEEESIETADEHGVNTIQHDIIDIESHAETPDALHSKNL